MPGVSGVDFVVQVNTGTEAAPIWTTVGGQRNATLHRTTDTINLTTKDSNGWEENEPTIRHWSIDFDALLLEDDAGYAALEDAYDNKKQLQVQVLTPAGNKYTGKATLADLTAEGPMEEATISGTLTGSGPLTKTSAV